MRRLLVQFGCPLLCLLLVSLLAPQTACAQDSKPDNPSLPSTQDSASVTAQENSDSGDVLTLFPHSDTAPFWISGQANVIFQWHPSFPAKYSGPNSFHSEAENATSKVYTLYLGYELTHTTEVFMDVESAGGHGLSAAFGLAGFTNLDVVRNPELGLVPYLARAMVRQIIPLSDDRVSAERGPFGLATSLPARRLEFRIGKFGLVDFFDANSWGTDSHLQFLNWTVDNNGAYDYAANTRGYTDGAILEYDDHWFAARFAVTMEPKAANGINLDADIARARSEDLEFQASGKRIAHRNGTVRLLSYVNQADMGNYKQAIAEFLDHETATPNIVDTRRQGRHRYGFGLNFEQSITDDIGVFGRLGWSDGQHGSWGDTEDDPELELGGFSMGAPWHRRNDRAGVAFVANGITADHQQYLALGGLGFLLGDGALTYGPEKIFEGFYTVHLWRGFLVGL